MTIPAADHAPRRRDDPEDRHRAPAPRQRGFLTRASAAVRRRRRDGRRAGRRGRLADRGRDVRAGPAGRRARRRSGSRTASRRRTSGSTSVSRTEHERAGMGTTLTAAYLDDAHLAIAHVGDSRAYLFRDGKLTRLTQDHSLVDELVRRGQADRGAGRPSTRSARSSRARSGPEPTVEVDTWTLSGARPATCCCCAATASPR